MDNWWGSYAREEQSCPKLFNKIVEFVSRQNDCEIRLGDRSSVTKILYLLLSLIAFPAYLLLPYSFRKWPNVVLHILFSVTLGYFLLLFLITTVIKMWTVTQYILPKEDIWRCDPTVWNIYGYVMCYELWLGAVESLEGQSFL